MTYKRIVLAAENKTGMGFEQCTRCGDIYREVHINEAGQRVGEVKCAIGNHVQRGRKAELFEPIDKSRRRK